jgi:leucyl aminopeptidase
MNFEHVDGYENRKAADCLILPFFKKGKKAVSAFNKEEIKLFVNTPIESGDFVGKIGDSLFLYPGKEKEKRILLLGFGEEANINEEAFRRAISCAVKRCNEKKIEKINIVFPKLELENEDKLFNGLIQGFLLTNYSFEKFKSEKKDSLIKDVFIIGASKKYFKDIEKEKIIADGVFFARDMVNNNADLENPEEIAKKAKALETISTKVTVDTFNRKKIEKEGLGLVYAVSRGSVNEPTFNVIEYVGNPASKKKSVIIGKGVTYDTGGLCLKPAAGMIDMKSDMGGAAVVVATMKVLAQLKAKVNVVGIIPATENAISGSSYKTGDVYTNYAGKTVEVTNTDAEGRLILADSISYAQKKYSPDRIIDIATLTGAVSIALGEEIAGVFSNNEKLYEDLQKASKTTGELIWRLPLYKEYKEHLDSKIADIKNSSSRIGSLIDSALFLEFFIDGKTPWAHIDIGGPAYLSKDKWYHKIFGTGIGVRLLVDLFESI